MLPLVVADAFEHLLAKQISDRLGPLDASTFVGRFEQLSKIETDVRAELRPLEEMIESYALVLDKMHRRLAASYVDHQMEQHPGRRINVAAKGMRTRNFDFRTKLWLEVQRRREQAIVLAVRRGTVSWAQPLAPELRYGASLDERVIEVPLALEIAALGSPGKVLDAGASLNQPFLHGLVGRFTARVTHFTQSGDKEDAAFDGDHRSYQFGDVRDIDYKSGTFDRVVCVSTLEHVGMDNSTYGARTERHPDSYLDALRELIRVLRPGGRLLVSFPYGRARDLGAYQVFGAEAVGRMTALVEAHRWRIRYFRYNGFWSDATDESEVSRPERAIAGEDVAGLAVLLVDKRGRASRPAAASAAT